MGEAKGASSSDGYPVEKKSGSPAPSYHEEPPDLTAGFAKINLTGLSLSSQAPPRTPEVVAHLKLLHAFSNLKEDVGYKSGLFGLGIMNEDDEHADKELLAKVREKRWAIYVARAVDRFEVWWKTVVIGETIFSPMTKMLTLAQMENESWYKNWPRNATSRPICRDELPPLGETFFFVTVKNTG
jgi:hypothetical protein